MTEQEAIAYIKAIKNGLHETGKDFPYRDDIIPLAKEALDMAIKVLEQDPCENVPGINDGNIYECSCGYGWDRSKVVRHHFCPNCGRAVLENEL